MNHELKSNFRLSPSREQGWRVGVMCGVFGRDKVWKYVSRLFCRFTLFHRVGNRDGGCVGVWYGDKVRKHVRVILPLHALSPSRGQGWRVLVGTRFGNTFRVYSAALRSFTESS